jgi:solute carrier family 25 (mitochondrial phosphate transporter), member 3
MNIAGEEISSNATYKGLIWCAASASAEVFADVALCPFEMTKVRIQTSTTGTFPTGFGAALVAMRQFRSETRFPFGSLVPLWSRQARK